MITAQYVYRPLIILSDIHWILTFAGLQRQAVKPQINLLSRDFLCANIYSVTGRVCSLWIAAEMAPWSLHGHVVPLWVFVPMSLHWKSVHWRMATDSMGLESFLSEPAVISAITGEIVESYRVELTVVKIHLETNHAANRGTGIPAAATAWLPSLRLQPFMGNISALPLTVHL